MLRTFLSLFFLSVCAVSAADRAAAPPLLQPDPRFKADVLIVIAHPDDDTVLGGYLAKMALDEHRSIAVVYCTPGNGGGNVVGNEAGESLGEIRMLEARRSLGFLGIQNIWFVGGHDTPGQNVLWSLDSWNHGRALDEVVRLVRLTRPDVIMTWLPEYVVGENHSDHQASGVLATEAFDLAGDPTKFPEQVSVARDRTGMMNYTEGLLPWQPQKLYYFTDAYENFTAYWHDASQLSPYRKNFLEGRGPVYKMTEVSPSRHESYAKLAAEQQAFYKTQEGELGERAVQSGDVKGFEYPIQLIFGKSLVGGSATGDVFENVSAKPVPFKRVHGYEPEPHTGLSFEIGDPWRFYSLLWKAHDLNQLSELMPVPEASAGFGQTVYIDMLACNHGASAADIAVKANLPAGWMDKTKWSQYPVPPGACYPVQAVITAPRGKAEWQQLSWTATSGGTAVGTVNLRMFVTGGFTMPQ
jgi:LmbE family N-acetylglucosaminyl deacetylase